MNKLAKAKFVKNDMCHGGGIGKCLPLQAEMSELKSVNCGEALTCNDEGNPQPSRREIEGRFRDYNHSVQTDNAEDDGIVQTTTASDSGSGKLGVVLRHSGFKIRRPSGLASSSLARGTIFPLYELRVYDKNNQLKESGKYHVQMILRNNGRFMIKGEAIFKKNVEGGKYRMELADRVRDNQILEADLFFLSKQLKNHFKKSVKRFEFVKISQ